VFLKLKPLMNYVLKLCGWYPSKVDALSGDFVQRQAVAISRQCKTVVLFAQKDPSLRGSEIETAFSKNGNLFEYVYYYPKRNWLDKLWSQWYYMRVLKLFLPMLLKEHGRPSLVHVNVVWRAAIWALYLRRKYGWPIVVTEHSTEYQPNALENIRHKSASRKLITRNTFKYCKLLMPVSVQLATTIRALYGNIPYQVIPNVVDTSLFFFKPRPVTERPVRLLHVSTMGYQKNVEGIFRVLRQVAITGHLFEIIMVGPATEPTKNLIDKDSTLRPLVTFTGSITYPEVAALMQTADGLLLFSRYENLPCVILEALCCGVPVITSDVGGIPEVIDESNGVLVPEGNEFELLSALTSFIKGDISFDHSTIAQKACNQFSYETIGRSFIDAYRQVIPLNETG
jgi:glycosyltransferase involved in cell wall biosynthesis